MTKERTITRQPCYLFKDQVETLQFYALHESYKQCRPIKVPELVRVAVDEYIEKLKQIGV